MQGRHRYANARHKKAHLSVGLRLEQFVLLEMYPPVDVAERPPLDESDEHCRLRGLNHRDA
jgi:hypothetical protein